jgi:SSS family solute:Na+ symporter
MTANLISLVFNINIIWSLLISLLLSLIYLLKGGYRSDLYTDALQFFVMFAGFIIIMISAYNYAGGITFLREELPPSHLSLTGEASPFFIIVWFLIALWTFADPGFHQRCYAAKKGAIAKRGILISVVFWMIFDFLTTGTGLYAKAVLPGNINPVLSFPLLAEKILSPGLKGVFYAGLFATIMSTLNSFLFLSATTLGRDFFYSLSENKKEADLKKYTIYGLLIAGLLAVIIAWAIPSVIEIWYTIGSMFIPGIILPVAGAYYYKLKISSRLTIIEICLSVFASFLWFILRDVSGLFISESEPMIAGLITALLVHTYGLIKKADKKTYQL